MTIPAGEYSIDPVPAPLTAELRREVVAFWLSNGAIGDAAEAQRRTSELVCVARDGGGEIAGVNTAYRGDLPSDNAAFYFYRMFIRPRNRQLVLALGLIRAAMVVLRQRSDPDVRGMALVTENPKLMRAGGRRLLKNLGWRRRGNDARGLDLWLFEF